MAQLKYLSSLILFTLAISQSTLAFDEKILFPLDCVLGKTCWISNLARHYQDGKQVDFRCHKNTYDGHKGTDFALQDLRAMKEGVNVLAPLDGRIRGIRDGMDDVSVRITGKRAVKGKECGNGIVVATDMYEFQLCHLKKGSILVKKGEQVTKGQILAQIGLSGNTEYPHLHLSVRKKVGKTMREFDPFYSLGNGCGMKPEPIWEDEASLMRAAKTGIVYNYGLAYDPVKPKDVRSGAYRSIKYKAKPEFIVGWVDIFSPNKGDKVIIKVRASKIKEFAQKTHEFNRYQARYYLYTGAKLKGKTLPKNTKIMIEYHHSDGKVERFEKGLE